MRTVAAFVAGAALALGIPSLAHDAEHLADHHGDCAEEVWSDRPGFGDIHFEGSLDPASPHDTYLMDLNVCRADVDFLNLHVELWRGYDKTHADVDWRVGADGLAEAIIGHLDPETAYTIRLLSRGYREADARFITAARPTTPATTTSTTTTTLPTCVMPTTTTTTTTAAPTTTTTTTTTTTAPPETATMPGLLGQGWLKADAERLIIAAGLVPAPRAVPTDNQDANLLVIAQDPPVGATLPAGSVVRFDYWQYTSPEG